MCHESLARKRQRTGLRTFPPLILVPEQSSSLYPLHQNSAPSLQSSQHLKHTACYFKVTAVTFQNKTVYYKMKNVHFFLERTNQYPSVARCHTPASAQWLAFMQKEGMERTAFLSPPSSLPMLSRWKQLTSFLPHRLSLK